MKFKLVYTRRAVKDIGKLDKQIYKRIKESLERYSQDPFTHADFNRLKERIGGYKNFRQKTRRLAFRMNGWYLWSKGYFGSTIGKVSAETIQKYIREQKTKK